MARSKKNASEWNTLANKVTIIRILFIPVFVVVILTNWPQWFFGNDPQLLHITQIIQPWIAMAIYSILALTDGLDGYLARSRNEVTTLGKFLDPIADKILVAAALIAFVELRDIPAWVALVIISREFIVSGLRMIAASEGIVIAAGKSGKIKTALTLVAIILFIIKRTELVMSLPKATYRLIYLGCWTVMTAALIMTIVSLFIYFAQARYLFGGKSDIAAARESVAKNIIERASEIGVHVATAESCTGGMIGQTLTSVPGSSQAYEGSIVSYSNSLKRKALGIEQGTLDEFSPVSEEVAKEMAEGVKGAVLRRFDENERIAISTTGVAGPGADADGNPEGLVWIGISGCGETLARKFNFSGDRESIRAQATEAALKMLEERLLTL
ncbi:MAG: CDP-diacylglycerol--glycerol-3-phosphate 3-phosphatidyltransferase [Coriobacteriales bacterium]|nr:CDP-diacylglycerol--glycerol-3-phosphate 3-phosphatidyltransferase [Coriobacteriales bacterium]